MTAMRSGRAALAAAAAVLAACSADTATITPLAWQKVENSTTGQDGSVLALNPTPGSFDEVGNFTVSAFKDGDTTFLYYGGADASGTACPGINTAHWRIGLATSKDGVNFTRVPGDATGGALLDNGAPGR